MRKEREQRQLEKLKNNSASLIQRYIKSLGVKQKEHKKLVEEENVISITNEMVKVIQIQIKKLQGNEVAIQKTIVLILTKALPSIINKINALLYFELHVRVARTYNKEFVQNLATTIGYVSKVGGLTKFAQIAD